jgi:hypothetical protein
MCCRLLLLAAAPPELLSCKVLKLLVLTQLRSSAACLLVVEQLQPPALLRLLLLTAACMLLPQLLHLSAAAAADQDGMAMASPKSPSMACLPETNTFSGLMSRCTKPCMHITKEQQHIKAEQFDAVAAGTATLLSMNAAEVGVT